MFKYIDQLREKPEAVRRRYAFGISAAIVLVLGGIWSYHLTHKGDDSVAIDNAPSPLQALTQNIKEGFASTKQSIVDNNPFKATTPAVNASEEATSSPQEASSSVQISDTPGH